MHCMYVLLVFLIPLNVSQANTSVTVTTAKTSKEPELMLCWY